MVSVALVHEPSTPEQTPLSPAERARLRELILTVNRGMTQFLEVGRALMEIKEERL